VLPLIPASSRAMTCRAGVDFQQAVFHVVEQFTRPRPSGHSAQRLDDHAARHVARVVPPMPSATTTNPQPGDPARILVVRADVALRRDRRRSPGKAAREVVSAEVVAISALPQPGGRRELLQLLVVGLREVLAEQQLEAGFRILLDVSNCARYISQNLRRLPRLIIAVRRSLRSKISSR